MNPLVTAQKVLTWLSLLRPDDSASDREKRAFIAFTSTVIAFLIMSTIGSVIFIWKFALIDFGKSLFAFCIALAVASVLYAVLVAYILQPKILIIFDELKKIYDACKFIVKNVQRKYCKF